MNQQVIIQANLESSKIHGVLYEGMMRGVECSNGEDVALLTINKMAPNGSKVE